PIELWVAGVKPDGQKHEVWLTIDGYPRAMAYTIVCDDPPANSAREEIAGIEYRQNVKQVRLKSLSMPSPAYPRMFLYTPNGSPLQKLADMAKALEKQPTFLAADQPAYFPAA